MTEQEKNKIINFAEKTGIIAPIIDDDIPDNKSKLVEDTIGYKIGYYGTLVLFIALVCKFIQWVIM